MDCVKEGKMFGLRSPKDQQVLREVNARELWQRILETRLQTGEPYILNIDAVNRALPKHQRELGLKVNTSNLCSEITLPTGADHDGKERTAGLLPVVPEYRDLGPVGRGRKALSRTCCACSTMC
jgi:ribonucleoside-diphosphate reductase alpha chain